MDIKGKVVIVTGASSGIGFILSKMLTQNGAKVALVARTGDILEKLSKELKDSFPISCDMSKENEVINMVKMVKDHYGRIDILINNAGRGYYSPIEKVDTKILHELFDLNLVGPIVAMREVIHIMKDQGEGRIINISSGTALMYIPNMSIYSSLKRALGAISFTANEELKEYNIKVSVVYPTLTDTNFGKNAARDPEIQFRPTGTIIPDTPEYISEKIIESIKTNDIEIFAHREMEENRK